MLGKQTNLVEQKEKAGQLIIVIYEMDNTIRSSIPTNKSIPSEEVIRRSGLCPRDGSNVFLKNSRGIIQTSEALIKPGSTVFIGSDSIIEHCIIDNITWKSKDGNIGTGKLADGTIAHVPNVEKGEKCWIVRHTERKSLRDPKLIHAECHKFNLGTKAYNVGDIVRARPSPDNSNSLLFDPHTELWSINLKISLPEFTDEVEISQLFKGLLWSVKITHVNRKNNRYKGRLLTSLTYNPKLSKKRRRKK